MGIFIGRFLILAVFVYLAYLWFRNKPAETTQQRDVIAVHCLSPTHPVNCLNVDINYIQHWYLHHDFADELACVSTYGTEAEMRYYLDHLADWMQKATFKTESTNVQGDKK